MILFIKSKWLRFNTWTKKDVKNSSTVNTQQQIMNRLAKQNIFNRPIDIFPLNHVTASWIKISHGLNSLMLMSKTKKLVIIIIYTYFLITRLPIALLLKRK